MSEIPERIEREMFEIRSRMAPDVTDLKKHVDPSAVGKKVSKRIKERVKNAVVGFGKSLFSSGPEPGRRRRGGRKETRPLALHRRRQERPAAHDTVGRLPRRGVDGGA